MARRRKVKKRKRPNQRGGGLYSNLNAKLTKAAKRFVTFNRRQTRLKTVALAAIRRQRAAARTKYHEKNIRKKKSISAIVKQF